MLLTLITDTSVGSYALGILELSGRKFHALVCAIIPDGTYRFEQAECEAYGKHFRLVNQTLGVYRDPLESRPGGIAPALLHAANRPHELRASIAVGKERRKVSGEWRVEESRSALNEMRTLIGHRVDAQLVIQRRQ